MNAKLFVEMHGELLIGRQVRTQAIGDYPGGAATVIEIAPDPSAPEIVCQVKNPDYKDDDGEIGIFEHEDLSFA